MRDRHSGDTPDAPASPNYPADAFAGTATSYARYRVPYPLVLLDDLRARAGITGAGRLLDLACGPGRVALQMAPFFREVWAIDLEPEMIEVGKSEAARIGRTNLRWQVGRAEDLSVPDGAFELVTIGEAFHRLDQRTIAARALAWLCPGGCLATLGGPGVFEGDELWQALGRAVLERWGIANPGGGHPASDSAPHPNERVLRAAGFAEVASYQFAVPYVWSLESIIGYLASTSVATPRVLGERAAAFAADLRRTLLTHDARDHYPATLPFGYTLARRPPHR